MFVPRKLGYQMAPGQCLAVVQGAGASCSVNGNRIRMIDIRASHRFWPLYIKKLSKLLREYGMLLL